ncbi:Glycosyltransferase [Granulibacter bethesdensis]|uniref:glycosyltransferase family 2 protein n=1 Tax=Granulibacter bethesdensis TaxID=364410 RepID=UPI00090AD752|nr:glycosyltransferase [Granulibacter bethesdensis]APH56964.1 Glycosyltransferase [Granulibacter bethesdensis]
MTVDLYTVCWNEADMLGFFFRHFDSWVDRYVIYDDGSTDGSLEILEAHPKVELRRFERVHTDSFVLSHKAMHENAWKESRGKADWVVITAIDEHLWVKDQPMRRYLQARMAEGVTCIPALGFDMNSENFPSDDGLLVGKVTSGRARRFFNKLGIFNPDAIMETGFAEGRHSAQPQGNIRLPARDELMLWHFKHLGYDRNAERQEAQGARLGSVDVQNDWGHRYRWNEEKRRKEWDYMVATSDDLSGPDFVAARSGERPLWWEGLGRISVPTVHARPQTAPRVSVVIKSYNHEQYVAQSLQSVFDQSFQDFEIILTDDASSDGTLSAIRQFSDTRLDVEALTRNVDISSAMNHCLKRARGEYIAILNSDDWALPERLARQVAFLDQNAHISAVFGLPRTVDEHGQKTESFLDFAAPMQMPDFSSTSWLRRFALHGNCLCAPTAMIRRSVFGTLGYYDPRLTNLQDFDMWTRMLVSGHDIAFLNEELTAFRIREGARNMSAPSRSTILRTEWETPLVLRHLKTLNRSWQRQIFRATLGIDHGPDHRGLLADFVDMAVRSQNAGRRLFAIEMAHACVQTQDGYEVLKWLTGEVDVFRYFATENSPPVSTASSQEKLDLLEEQLRALTRQHQAMLDSTIWRYTAPLRHLLHRLRR